MLDNYAHEYEDLVRARDAHKIEMDTLRSTNARLSTQVYVPIRSCRLGLWSGIHDYLRSGTCRKTLESDLAQLNTEHCHVLVSLLRGWRAFCVHVELTVFSQNELVMARLRHEELESELVRYKLLCVFCVQRTILILDLTVVLSGTPKRCTKARTRCLPIVSRSLAASAAVTVAVSGDR